MTLEVADIADEAFGGELSAARAEAAMAAARSLIDADPGEERWVKPLIRAIERKRLRLPSISPTVDRVVKLIESPDVDLDELATAVNGDPVLATGSSVWRTAPTFAASPRFPTSEKR